MKNKIMMCFVLAAGGVQPAHAVEWKKFKKPLLGLGAAAVSACITYQGIKRGNGEIRSNAATLGNICGAFWAMGSAAAVTYQDDNSEDGFSTFKYLVGANFTAMFLGFYVFMKLNPDIPITDAFRKK